MNAVGVRPTARRKAPVKCARSKWPRSRASCARSSLEVRRPGVGVEDPARFPSDELGAEHTGLSHQRLRPGQRQAFAHRHHRAEEVYIVLSGSGRVKIGDEIIDLGPLDAIRIGPELTRAFEAGHDGLEYVVVGPRWRGDAEVVPDWWT